MDRHMYEYVDTDSLAAVLNVTRRAILNLNYICKGPKYYREMGNGKCRYRVEDVRDWLEEERPPSVRKLFAERRRRFYMVFPWVKRGE